MSGSKDSKYRSARVVSQLGLIPLILAVSPLVGFGMGYLLDQWLGTGQVLRLVFLGLGFIAGVREMIRLLRRAQKDVDRL